MKIGFDRIDLKNALKRILPITRRKSSFAVFANVLITAKDGICTLIATNLDTAVRVHVPANVMDEGEALVDAVRLSRAADTKDDIVIEKDGNVLALTSGTLLHRLPLADIAEFPSVEFYDGEYECEIDADDLRSIVQKASYAVSKDESRGEFTGAHLVCDGGKAQMTTTDGNRLAQAECHASGDLPAMIVPGKDLPTLSELSGTVSMHACAAKKGDKPTHLLVKSDALEMRISLINGMFPDFTKVFPSKFDAEICIDSRNLRDMVKAVGMAAPKETQTIRLELNPKSIRLYAHSGKIESSASVECELTGIGAVLGMNWTYLIDALNACNSTAVRIGVVDSDSPCVIWADETASHIVMPMQV
jgi:DNA polymerase-3 subunit beta